MEVLHQLLLVIDKHFHYPTTEYHGVHKTY